MTMCSASVCVRSPCVGALACCDCGLLLHLSGGKSATQQLPKFFASFSWFSSLTPFGKTCNRVLLFFLPGIFPLSFFSGQHFCTVVGFSFGPTVVIVAKAAKRRRWNCSNCNNKMAPGVGPALSRFSTEVENADGWGNAPAEEWEIFPAWLILTSLSTLSFGCSYDLAPQLPAKFIQRKMCNVETCRMWRGVVGVVRWTFCGRGISIYCPCTLISCCISG